MPRCNEDMNIKQLFGIIILAIRLGIGEIEYHHLASGSYILGEQIVSEKNRSMWRKNSLQVKHLQVGNEGKPFFPRISPINVLKMVILGFFS